MARPASTTISRIDRASRAGETSRGRESAKIARQATITKVISITPRYFNSQDCARRFDFMEKAQVRVSLSVIIFLGNIVAITEN
jgi:hypothetical protein